jgi:adenylate cyclase
MARLLLATPEGNQVVELLAHNSLGRHPGNTIQLLDRIVSKEHCIIEQRGELFVLRDLGSLNGTYVNGDRVVGERALRSGDEIALGATRARYEQDVSQAHAAAQPPAAPVAPPAVAAPASDGGWTSSNVAPGVAKPVPTSAADAENFGVARAPLTFAFGSMPSMSDTNPMPFASSMPPMSTRRIDVTDKARAIGTQIAAAQKGFLPYDALASNPHQLAADYERLRLSHELSREIALERDLPTLLDKILLTIFKFIRADRGAIFLMAPTGELVPAATRRRDGTDQPITVSSTILNHVIEERATVLTHDAAMDFAASKGKSMILNRISSAVVAPLLHNDEVLGVLWLDSESLAQFQQKDMEIATAIAAQAAMFIEINILGKKIEQEIVHRERFSRLLSPNIAERVLSGELEVKKGGQLVPECTVFNSDIRGFTRMSEGAPPESIVEMLNEYFELMVETLFKFEGTLDKFMGDGIMALWGAPVVHPDDPVLSVDCAIEQLEVLERFNQRRTDVGLLPLGMGIGIHTGPLVAGYIGSSKALSYTVIGDTANTSARLCGIAQAGQILVSEQTLARLGSRFLFDELPPAHLKGKEKPFRVFAVHGRAPRVPVVQALGPTLDGR